jgi:O-antigen/teichoic acid export membrane protein
VKHARILRNTFALAIPNILNPIVSFALILVISRYIGVEGLGEYSLIMAYIGIFSTLASLGLADLVVREVAKRPDQIHEYLFNAGVFGVISSFLAFASMNLMVFVMGYDAKIIWAAFIASFSLLASTAITYLEAIFRSVENSKYIAFAFVTENIAKVTACILLLLNGYGVISLFFVVVITRFFSMILLCFYYFRLLGKPGFSFSPEIWKVLLKEAPTFTSIAVFSTIHLSMDSIMLSKLKSVESVGIYSAADRLLTVCKTVPTAFAAALLPFFTMERIHSLTDLKIQVQNTIKYLSILLVPIVIGTFVLADQFILLIYGNKFDTAGQVLRFHIISLIPFSMVYLLAQVLIATDNQRIDLTINIVAAIANFLLNLLLIPRFAEMGAVFATLISIIIFNELQYFYLRKYLFNLSILAITFKILMAGLIMGTVTYFFSYYNLVFVVVISAMVYIGLILGLRIVSLDELWHLKLLLTSSNTRT